MRINIGWRKTSGDFDNDDDMVLMIAVIVIRQLSLMQ